jgi:hypothetical protein
MPVIPALRRLRQEDHEFKAILSYVVRPWLNQTKENFYFLHHTGHISSTEQSCVTSGYFTGQHRA